MSAVVPRTIDYGWDRVLSGPLLAPPAAGLVVGAGFGMLGALPALAIAPLYAGVLGWPTGLVLGIPAYRLLRHRRDSG